MMADDWVAMRPEGIRGCSGHDHPVLLLQEVGGPRRVLLQIDEGEAGHLAGVFSGARSRHSRTYEMFEQAIEGFGARVTALRVVGDRQRGMRGEIEIAGDCRQTVVGAHPGDVAALAWRLQVDVHLPSEVTSRATATCREWPLAAVSEAAPALAGPFVAEADPEDYDW